MTNNDGAQSGPLSWRDVAYMVKSSQDLILMAVGGVKDDVAEVKRDVAEIKDRVTTLERQDDHRAGAAEERRKLGALSKNSLTTIAAVAAVIIGVVNFIHG